MLEINMKKGFIIVAVAIAVIIFITQITQVVDTVDLGYYKVKQSWPAGNISIKSDPGVFAQWWGDLHPYQVSDIYYFSKSDLDGGSGEEAAPIKVRFNDGGTAEISGSVKFKLSTTEKDAIMLHKDFKSYRAVKNDLIRQVAIEALMQSATLMKAEESYSTRRAEFTSFAEDQIVKGIFRTYSKEKVVEDAEGKEFIERQVKVLLDSTTSEPIIRKLSPLKRYNVEVLQFVIKEIDFDKTIDDLIAKKKEAEQKKVVAKANAERAKQDAITAEEEGKATIAKAEAEELTIKMKEVTQAQKRFEIAEYEAKEALEVAKQKRAIGEAEAYAAKLKVAAGLTPLEKATIEKETAIGVADAMKSIQFPVIMMIGGGDKKGGGGTQLNPFDAVGLKAFKDIVDDMAKAKK